MHTKIDPNVRKMVTIHASCSTFVGLMSQTMMVAGDCRLFNTTFTAPSNLRSMADHGLHLMIGVIAPGFV
ncbi:hypothetical protein ACW18Z_05040 [Limosilactobacillus fermentum]